MARTPADPVARLAKLEAARKALPRKRVVLNFADMASAAGMSARNLREIIDSDPGFPILKKGGEGVPYEFDARAVLDHMIRSARAVKADRERRKARVSRLAGLGAPVGGGPSGGHHSPAGGGQADGPGTAAQMLEEARALSMMIDVQAKIRAEKERQGLLLPRDEVQPFLWRWLGDLQAEVLAIEARIDKAGKLEPEVRAAVKEELAGILVKMRLTLEKGLAAWNAPRNESNRGRARAA